MKNHFKNNLILITGHPGSGKSTLALKLQKELKFPILERDELKEDLYDSLKKQGKEIPSDLGRISYDQLYGLLRSYSKTFGNLILVSNFNPSFSPSKAHKIHAPEINLAQ
ncbi:MAG: hypothetical protein DRQ88_11730 [Epsilonproteobacteria bacterium]|nr:MAG: hypothetical protein DRQ88_11730 [Campylobacterota bacterium]